MTISIFMPESSICFSPDAADILRVFYGDPEFLINQPGGDMIVTQTESEAEGVRTVTVAFEHYTCRNTAPVLPQDALENKRLHKRQIKLALYACLKEATGMTPPWGSLTGIRPTRLVYAAMQKGMTAGQALQDVQSLFDISPEKTALLGQIIAVQSALSLPETDEVDIYIGIPFCVTRCAYCSFLSGEVGKGKQLIPYRDALVREIAAVTELIKRTGLRPRAFYMGGGTPTALSAELLESVLHAAEALMAPCRERTVEAGRPDTINRKKLSVIRNAGVTRISINPQTMHDETLRLIGRAHTRQQCEEAYILAREMGFHHINMDLIAGLPGENEEMFGETLAWSREMHPESLTVHTLSIKRSSLMHLWQSQLPDGDMTARMVRMGAQEAEVRGMQPYYMYRQKHMAGNLENVGYALPGHACIYNVDMMEETGNILALGAGGISKRVWPSGGKIVRAPNVSDIDHYIARVGEMIQRKYELWGASL